MGGNHKWVRRAALLGTAAATASGLGIGLTGGPAGAAVDPNYSFAQTQGLFGVAWSIPFMGFGVSFKTGKAVNVSFRVNGSSHFNVPAVFGPNISDPSGAAAKSTNCTGCETNAIAIIVDVVSGPVTTVSAPTNATVTMNGCTNCNATAADYVFIVSPGVEASLLPTALGQLSSIAAQLNADANMTESSGDLAGQVVQVLGEIQAVLSDPNSYDPLPNVVVQRSGSIQTETS